MEDGSWERHDGSCSLNAQLGRAAAVQEREQGGGR